MKSKQEMLLEAVAIFAAVAEKMQEAPAEQAKEALLELGEFAAITLRVAQEPQVAA